jgi:tryptophan halogenase
MKEIKKILIVGGGTAGLITALILKKHLNMQVDVVYSKDIGIIGVGEGSTEHFRDFLQFVGIDHYELLKQCDATYKSGIMFKDWGSKDYLHNVGEPFNNRVGQYPMVYANQIAKGDTIVTSPLLWKNKINKWFINQREEFPFNQFHFNTHKLNDFLITIAKDMGVGLYDDKIVDVILDESGDIAYLQGEKTLHNYDFYIDSTGFRRILMNKLGARWESFGKYLKMKSAITFPTGDTEEYNLWTLAKAMKNGWMFRIPVWGRHGNGYIYDSDYTDAEQAKKEVEEYFGHDIEVGKEFNFDPGKLDRAWIRNCVAVGLSGSFVEPLEATSIGSSIVQSFMLMHKIVNYDQNTIDKYNKSFDDILYNIRDFIILHYINDRRDSDFWKDISKLELPESLLKNIETWKNKLPLDEDFNTVSDYVLFKAANFTVVMEGLNLFNRENIIKEYNSYQYQFKDYAVGDLRHHFEFNKSITTIGHKEYISIIRKYF